MPPRCVVCGAEPQRFVKRFLKKGRTFWRCGGCGFETQHPLPTPGELRRYYEQSYQDGLYRDFVEAREIKKLTARERLRQVKPYCRPGRWLDVGCANGVFVAAAREAGMDAEGIEMAAPAVEEAQKASLPVSQATIEQHDPGYLYDTITAFDVLEHVLDPMAFLRAAHRLLVPGGSLAIAVPNQASLSCRLMGPRWYFYIPEEHLHYYNPSTMRKLAARCGFESKRCTTAYKYLTFSYSLLQFREYNPWIYKLLSLLARLLPKSALEYPVALPIGEMLFVGTRETSLH